MAYQDIPENQDFTTEVHKVETEDPVHADLVNDIISKLLTNEVFLKNNKADIESPEFTGEPKVPTPPQSSNGAWIATTAFVGAAVSSHDASPSAHDDMRQLISGLAARMNALADSDDTTLDQLSEIVAYIKNNKSLIDGVTTSKVSVSDIIDSLTSAATNKPLSAKQGKTLKDLVDALTTTAGGKVDKVAGKGLSANDFTDEEKSKLAGIAANANNYSLPLAASGTRGGVKTGYAQNGKNYPVQLSGEKMYVNVPWTDNNTTYNVVSKTANGLAPQLPNETTTTKYLRQDGTWQIPPNTDTWRGIRDSLDSSSSTDSLSANQGKVLKGLIDAMQWKTLTHAAFTVNSGTLGESGTASGTIVSGNDNIKSCKELYIPSLESNRGSDAYIVRAGRNLAYFVSTYHSGSGWFLAYNIFVDFKTGTVTANCLVNTWGISVLPMKLPANSILYR